MTRPSRPSAITRPRLLRLAALALVPAAAFAAAVTAQRWAAPPIPPEVKTAMDKADAGQPADLIALADAGRTEAQVYAGVMLIYGRRGVAADPKKGCAYEDKASMSRADAMHLVGVCWQNGLTGAPDPAKAEAAYLLAARMGYPKSNCALGQMLLGQPGQGERGLGLCKESASAGDVDAQLAVADAYFRGRGIKADHKEARKWYAMAADQKDNQALQRLGEMYASGDGGKKDVKKAIALWQDAEKAGNPLVCILVADQLFSDLTGGKTPGGGTYAFKGGVPVEDLDTVESWYQEALQRDPRPDVKQRAERGIQVVRSLKSGAKMATVKK